MEEKPVVQDSHTPGELALPEKSREDIIQEVMNRLLLDLMS